MLSVIIPAYNEERNIARCIRETDSALAGLEHEIIVVDDGSRDATRMCALQAAAELQGVRVVGYDRNQGKGHALKSGYPFSHGELVAFLDGDLQIHPRQLLGLLEIMQRSRADVVVGCKRHAASQVGYSPFRRLVSAGYLWLTRLFFDLNLSDTQTGIKLFRREVLERVWPRVPIRRYAFDLALLVGAQRFNYRIAEAPVEITPYTDKKNRIGLQAILSTFFETLVIFYEASFWRWLNPGMAVRLWMLAFVLGLVGFSFGLAHLITFIDLPQPISTLAYYITLRFMDKQARDLLLIGAGLLIMASALVQLNKYILAAFARAESSSQAGLPPAAQKLPAEGEAREFMPEDLPAK
jgi:glycosyltransferase involved in cell wall biosynthesis